MKSRQARRRRGMVHWTHRCNNSTVKARTRAVSASDRTTLFESPAPEGSSIVLNSRNACEMWPVASNVAVTICDFAVLFSRLLTVTTALNSRGWLSESTLTDTIRRGAELVSRSSVRTNPRLARALSCLVSRQVLSDFGSSFRTEASTEVEGVEQSIVTAEQSEKTLRIAERRVVIVGMVRNGAISKTRRSSTTST